MNARQTITAVKVSRDSHKSPDSETDIHTPPLRGVCVSVSRDCDGHGFKSHKSNPTPNPYTKE